VQQDLAGVGHEAPLGSTAVTTTVIPAQAGIHTATVIPAKAGIHRQPVIPAKAGIHYEGLR